MTQIYVAGIAMTVFGRHPTAVCTTWRRGPHSCARRRGLHRAADRRRLLRRHHQRPAAGADLDPGSGRVQQDRHRGHPGLQRRERLCLGQLGIQSRRAEPQGRHHRRGARPRRREDEHPRQGEVVRDLRGRLGRLAGRGNLRHAGEDGRSITPPPGSESDRPYSKFMSIYAAFCRWHMKTYGTTQRQIAAVCAKEPPALGAQPVVAVPQALHDRGGACGAAITYPITLPMCAPLSDGAAAAILCTEEGLQRIGADRKRCIKVAASVVRSFTHRRMDEPEKHVSRLAARQAYEIAGLARRTWTWPRCTTPRRWRDHPGENLGLVPLGGGGPAAERGEFTLGGRIPVNPSGGLESKAIRWGPPASASSTSSSRSCAASRARQVEGARHAIQENGGGMQGVEKPRSPSTSSAGKSGCGCPSPTRHPTSTIERGSHGKS